ncbi:MAG: hypothetical protein IID34_09275 [Planctomycetes bacterium]|nr:hypothetical protein [Planctomycetota bacterium]
MMKRFDDVSMECGGSSHAATADAPFSVPHGATDVRREWTSRGGRPHCGRPRGGRTRGGRTRGGPIRVSKVEAAFRQLLFFGRALDLRADDHPVAWTEADGSFVVRFGERTALGGMDAKAVVSVEEEELVIDVHLAVDAGYSRTTDVAETRRFSNVRDAATFIAGRHVVHRMLTQE